MLNGVLIFEPRDEHWDHLFPNLEKLENLDFFRTTTVEKTVAKFNSATTLCAVVLTASNVMEILPLMPALVETLQDDPEFKDKPVIGMSGIEYTRKEFAKMKCSHTCSRADLPKLLKKLFPST